MDQGPPPMKQKKNPNAVDQFYADHSAEYDSRGQQSNPVLQVEAHNAVNPKMRDELDKRRSTSRVSAPTAIMARSQSTAFDPKCKICQKMKREIEYRKRLHRYSTSKYDRNGRVTKPRRNQRRPRSPYKLERVKINKGCQYYSPYSNKGTSPDLGLVGAEIARTKMVDGENLIYFSSLGTDPKNINNSGTILSGNNIHSEAVFPSNNYTNSGAVSSSNNNNNSGAVLSRSNINSVVCLGNNNSNSRPVLTWSSNNNSKTVLSSTSLSRNASNKSHVVSDQSGNPGTSVNTLSSYNSNLSLDHEPMVTSE